MALQIGNADIGADANGVQQAINNLRTHVIQDTISKMNGSMESLRASVDDAWVGHSAEIFKENMQNDKKTISEALEQTFEGLQNEINQIVSRMGEADENLIKGRN